MANLLSAQPERLLDLKRPKQDNIFVKQLPTCSDIEDEFDEDNEDGHAPTSTKRPSAARRDTAAMKIMHNAAKTIGCMAKCMRIWQDPPPTTSEASRPIETPETPSICGSLGVEHASELSFNPGSKKYNNITIIY